jgi:hypothetical protein
VMVIVMVIMMIKVLKWCQHGVRVVSPWCQ